MSNAHEKNDQRSGVGGASWCGSMDGIEGEGAGLISPGVEWRRLVQSTSLQSKIFVFKNRRVSARSVHGRTGDASI